VALWHNRLQALAASTRLGIPVTVSTDPRHAFTDNAGVAALAGAFSQWPEGLGLAALRSPELVQRFADIARQEYLAVGFRTALHPQIDLTTEPRWARASGTFGEDAELTSALAAAYIHGFQTDVVGPTSVSTMAKHFPGGGPQKDGEDPHFSYGREQIYPGGQRDYHLRPFRAAIAAGTTQLMPYYGMPVGTDWDEVGFAFNKPVIQDLLRDELGYDGVVCTDWGLVTDTVILGQDMPARAWGVEHVDEASRVQRILDAGCDQLGGEHRPELVVQLVESGHLSIDRIDASVRRILRLKFRLGLFEDPYVDEDRATEIVGAPRFVDAGLDAQRRSLTLLTNHDHTLPLHKGLRLYVDGLDEQIAAAYAEIVASPAEADLAVLRLQAPYERRPGAFEAMFHAGSLEFPEPERRRQAQIYSTVATIVDVRLDRPAVIPDVVAGARAVLASYGTCDAAFLDVIFGRAHPEGALPFDLPGSVASVEASGSDRPFDTEKPLFRFGHGLRYAAEPPRPG
jgi:beta-glucosidase